MIPKVIHQIFFPFKGFQLEENQIFNSSKKIAMAQNGFEYHLWNETEVIDLIENNLPVYSSFYKTLSPIQRIDFAKYVILYLKGGFYIDLDMYILKPLDDLCNEQFIFHNIKHIKPNYPNIENDFIACEPKLDWWFSILSSCRHNYFEKSKKEIYKKWKVRFVLQTTGPKFISREIKRLFPKYEGKTICVTKWETDIKPNDYIFDHKSNTWV